MTASGPDEVIPSIDKLSQDLREKSGESLREIRAGKPLDQVTTGSLEALQLYTQAADAYYARGDNVEARQLVDRTLAIDSTFAMGWRLLGSVVQGVDPALYTETSAKAYEHRDRLPDRERYMVEARYWAQLRENSVRAIAPYEALLAIEPNHFAALNNLGLIHQRLGDLNRAEELLRRGAYLPSARTRIPFLNMIGALLRQGRGDEAADALRDYEASYPDDPQAPLVRSAVAFVQGDLEAAAGHATEVAEDVRVEPRFRGVATAYLGRLALWRGRLDEAKRHFVRAEEHFTAQSASQGWLATVSTAFELRLAGQVAWGEQHAREGIEDVFAALPPLSRNHAGTASVFAMAGDIRSAETITEDWHAVIPDAERGRRSRMKMRGVELLLRVERKDTVGVGSSLDRLMLDTGCAGECWVFLRARLFDVMGERERAVHFYERQRQTGVVFSFFGPALENSTADLAALLRLGPLYEEMGDHTSAVDAYQRLVDQWADGDELAMETVNRFRARIAALES